MLIERWDPFAELRRPFRDFRSAGFHAATAHAEGARAESWRIPLDVVRDEDSVIVEASLPGVKPEDISVTIDDDVLRISGHTGQDDERASGTYVLSERRTGSFARSIRLPDSIDSEKAHTSYDAGVLTVTLPKLEAKKAKQLTVQVKQREEVAAT